MTRTLLAAALAAGAAFVASPAAEAACLGEQSTFYVCATTPMPNVGSTTYCVYAGGDTCEPVSVPSVYWTGDESFYCGGSIHLRACELVGEIIG